MWKVFAAVLLFSTVALADAPRVGRYERVGGWSYLEVPNSRSCGKEVRDFLRKSADQMRKLTVGANSIQWGSGGEGFPIVTRRSDSIVAAVSGSDEVNGVPIERVFAFAVQDDSVIFSRMILTRADGETVCGDALVTSLERR